MTKKRIWGITAIVVVILALCGTAVYAFAQVNQYKRDIQYGYKRSLNDLSDSVGNIETTLDKAVYANTATEQNGLAAKLMRETSMAQASLSTLPVGDNSLDNVSRFITQVGDFSAALSRQISAGGKITDDQYKTIKSLETYSQKLSKDMTDVQPDFKSTTFRDAMSTTAKDFNDFPSLIYDGPFSDNVMHQKPELTKGKQDIPQGNAQNIAADFLHVTQDKLTHVQDTAGNLPTYNFTANGGAVRINVTKAGGYVSNLSNNRDIGNVTLNYKSASKKAEAFLDSRGIKNMKESYYVITDGMCLINFAYMQDDVVCYPDLVKVGIALDNGEIVRFESAGYIMNHKARTLTTKISREKAQLSVSPKLTVLQSKKALIPTPGLGEVLTYEFLCTGTGKDRVLVYINAETGFEEDILILQQSDNGVLTK